MNQSQTMKMRNDGHNQTDQENGCKMEMSRETYRGPNKKQWNVRKSVTLLSDSSGGYDHVDVDVDWFAVGLPLCT
jgi:hypothetical protein